jgi:hypothetical protein
VVTEDDDDADGKIGRKIVIRRNYFALQAATLLKLARSTNDPQFAAGLIEKAADLQSKTDERLGPPSDQGQQAPGVAAE